MPPLLPFVDALALALREAPPNDRMETVSLHAAGGRVLAKDVVAGIDVPSFARAAMDGYAVRAAETAGASAERPVGLRCEGEIYAGQAPPAPLAPGRCLAIATGAPLPAGADAVVRVEDTAREGDTALIRASVKAGQNVDAAGSDIRVGERAAGRGAVLTPARVAACAAVGAKDLVVFQPPRVALLATGDEIVEPGRPLGPGQIYETNAVSVAALLERRVEGLRGALSTVRAPDRADALREALRERADLDLIVSTAGTSVGKKDLIPAVVREFGEVLFHGVAVKPGRPLLLAKLRQRTPRPQLFLGLPGFPTSCLMMAYAFLVPMVRRMANLPPWAPRAVRARMARAVTSPREMHQFLTVRLEADRAVPAYKESSTITSLSEADGWVEIPAGCEGLAEGSPAIVRLF